MIRLASWPPTCEFLVMSSERHRLTTLGNMAGTCKSTQQGYKANWQNYSGDYGSFASFVTHMRQLAEKKGVDLLVV